MSIDTKETLKDFSQNYDKVKDEFADMISFFRQYPDYFLDYIRAENALFELTPFQRVYLRAFFRYKKVGIIASRGVSKTYVNILAHYIKCVLYPNLHIGVIMPTKIQSAKISEEKIKEIWRDYPLLKNEIKKYKVTRDYVQFEFKGGSTLDTVASGESSRGLRAQGLSFEEIVDERMDRTTINEVLLPLLAQGRRTPHGVDTKNEQQKTQAWVTTAGAKQSFSYEKFQGLYDEMIDGKSTIVLGTSYEMGTKFGTLDINDIVDKLNDPSYSPLSFDKICRSMWKHVESLLGNIGGACKMVIPR